MSWLAFLGFGDGAGGITGVDKNNLLPTARRAELAEDPPVTGVATQAGDNLLHTPASGKRIWVKFSYVLKDPNQDASPIIQMKLGSTVKFTAYGAYQRTRMFIGAVDEPLYLNLSEPASVAYNFDIEEIDP